MEITVVSCTNHKQQGIVIKVHSSLKMEDKLLTIGPQVNFKNLLQPVKTVKRDSSLHSRELT